VIVEVAGISDFRFDCQLLYRKPPIENRQLTIGPTRYRVVILASLSACNSKLSSKSEVRYLILKFHKLQAMLYANVLSPVP